MPIGKFYRNDLKLKRFANIDLIEKIKCPIFFIHGQKDTLVPYSHSIQLSRKCKSSFELVMPENYDHNNFEFIDFIETLTKFLRRHDLLSFRNNIVSKIPKELYVIPEYLSKYSQSDFVTSILLKIFSI